MEYKIGKPLGFSELGIREIQEDSMYPKASELNDTNRTFIVCDGMGGHEKGEVASNTIVNSLSKGLEEFDTKELTVEVFNDLLENARQALDTYYSEDLGDHQMGTTLTFLFLSDNGYIAAHIGDSRIYHVRPDKVTELVYRSTDHTLASDLIQSGILTPVKALTFSEKNIINKALLPKTRHDVDIYESKDIKPGDYFMLCSDGVTEFLTDEMVRFIFAPYRTVDDIFNLIHQHCQKLSTDNNTCIIIPILSANAESLEPSSTSDDSSIENAGSDDLLQETIEYYSNQN